jgi:hypothetical protein
MHIGAPDGRVTSHGQVKSGGLYRTRGRCRSHAARLNLCQDPLVIQTRKRRKIAPYGNNFAKLWPNAHTKNASNTVSAQTGKPIFIAPHPTGHRRPTLAPRSSIFVRGRSLAARRSGGTVTRTTPKAPANPPKTTAPNATGFRS